MIKYDMKQYDMVQYGTIQNNTLYCLARGNLPWTQHLHRKYLYNHNGDNHVLHNTLTVPCYQQQLHNSIARVPLTNTPASEA